MSIPRVRVPVLDDLSLTATLVYLEAEGESWQGKLGVAWVVQTRRVRWRQSVPDVIFAPKQFSALNDDSPRRLLLDTLDPAVYADCYKAACGALFELAPDPTGGADHYLRVDAVLAAVGRLPRWAADPADPRRPDPAKVTAVIGRHTYLRLT